MTAVEVLGSDAPRHEPAAAERSTPRAATPLVLWSLMALHLCITSFNYIIVRPGLEQFGPLGFAALRFCISSAMLWALLLATHKWRPIARADRWPLVGLAVLAIPCNQVPYLLGIGLVPPEHGGLLYASTPIWVLLVARWLLGEKITKLKAIGVPLAFIGVVMVIAERGIRPGAELTGDLWLIFGVWGWAFYTVVGKPLSQRYGALQTTTLAISLGTLMVSPAFPSILARVPWERIDGLGWASMLYMTLLTSVVAYTMWYWFLAQMETGKVAVLQNLQPIMTIGWTLLLVNSGAAALFNVENHAITLWFLAAAALTIAGVVITQRG